MLSIRRKIYFLILAIILYFILTLIYNKIIVKNEYVDIYVLNKDVLKGEEITLDLLNIVKIKGINNNEYVDFANQKEYIANINMSKGQILTLNSVLSKEEYLQANSNKEIISLKIDSIEDEVSNIINKGSSVNIYYTGNTKQINEEYIKSFKDKIISVGKADGYTTFKFLENVSIIEIYDKNANVLKKGSGLLVNYINIEVDSSIALIINNLKEYGTFSLTLKEV